MLLLLLACCLQCIAGYVLHRQVMHALFPHHQGDHNMHSCCCVHLLLHAVLQDQLVSTLSLQAVFHLYKPVLQFEICRFEMYHM